METIQEYPYIFQSGKYKGRSLEWVFVNNPLHVSRIYSNMFTKRAYLRKRVDNKLQLAIDNLRSKIKQMKVVKSCPICKSNKVHFFLLPDSGAINVNLVCCQSHICQKELLLARPGELYLINDFLLILPYIGKKERKTVIRIFQKSHPVPLLNELV